MTHDELITPEQLKALPMLPPYSLTRVIAGKLRALYVDYPGPSPSRINELLDTLDQAPTEYDQDDRHRTRQSQPP